MFKVFHGVGSFFHEFWFCFFFLFLFTCKVLALVVVIIVVVLWSWNCHFLFWVPFLVKLSSRKGFVFILLCRLRILAGHLNSLCFQLCSFWPRHHQLTSYWISHSSVLFISFLSLALFLIAKCTQRIACPPTIGKILKQFLLFAGF